MYNCHSWGILRQVSRRHATSQLRSWITQRFYTSQNESYAKAAKISKPLRILFCGSDDFSSSSLRALRDEQIQNPDLIASIDVLCRPGKLSGRSLKTIREGS
jgi:DNA-binding LacI/PurR family transcriptional regulator